jgi:Phage terminase-like protein, large subunit
VKGPKAGELIHLEDWQCFILVNLFGWVDDKGLRRYIKAYIEVARGNGKSTLCSIIALYMLCADGEKGADVYSLATKKDQAKSSSATPWPWHAEIKTLKNIMDLRA